MNSRPEVVPHEETIGNFEDIEKTLLPILKRNSKDRTEKQLNILT